MKDPNRLLQKPSTSLSRLLLEAGAEEMPSAKLRSRTLGAVAAAGVISTASTAAGATAKGVELSVTKAVLSGAAAATGKTGASTTATIGLGMLVKWFGLGALAGVLAVPIVRAVVSDRRAPPPLPPVPDTTSAPIRQRAFGSSPARRASSTDVVAAPNEPDAHRDSETAKAQRAELARSSVHSEAPVLVEQPSSSDTPESTESALLAAEVQSVEQGREALQRGSFEQALARLAPYEARFPKAQLLTEVLFLRMEAYSREGNVNHARALALRLLERDLAPPQAARAREVLGH